MSRDSLVVGFIPLLDCAPLAVAAEKGFAARQGIDLNLVPRPRGPAFAIVSSSVTSMRLTCSVRWRSL